MLILLRVDSLDHEIEVRMRKTKERIKKRELTRKISTRKIKRKIIKIIKKLKVVLKKSRKITIATEVLDIRAKISTKKKTGLATLVLL
jgi:hypothetical protein